MEYLELFGNESVISKPSLILEGFISTKFKLSLYVIDNEISKNVAIEKLINHCVDGDLKLLVFNKCDSESSFSKIVTYHYYKDYNYIILNVMTNMNDYIINFASYVNDNRNQTNTIFIMDSIEFSKMGVDITDMFDKVQHYKEVIQ